VNWEAFFAIGALTVLLGGLLYVPSRWWANRKLKGGPHGSYARLHVTAAGFLFYGFLVGFLIIGLLLDYLAPESRLGQIVATGIGRFVLLVVVVAIGVALERVFAKLGVIFIQRRDV
jgi:hypothetical protein